MTSAAVTPGIEHWQRECEVCQSILTGGVWMLRRLVLALVLLCPASAWALQINDQAGWSFSQRFQGTSDASGTLLKTDSTVGYAADRYMNVYAGLPLYFSRPDAAVARGGS